MGRFDGKVALVTGAGSGIGAAVARGLATEGATAVVPADVSGEPPVDVSDPAQVDELVDRIVRDHGRLDVVVHAAGVDDPWAKGLIADSVVDGVPLDVASRLGDESWRRVMAVNLVAPGPTETGMADRTPRALRQRARYATADQIADVVLYLAGEESANLVGAVLLANGGRFTA
ncbi:SDR family NAD(P)-dependent oxidoreductase [Saccharothrix deserti]|uniref:SDR family NAD(P)-dependent oxidoreductase n=1 Tax=Saccharothrix deserti TaxID=2593674 RepID=UPI001EE3BB6D|nr:SDR family oxidoreductase [Saccharothrix deserti]